MKRVFVTVGTTKFPKLIDTITKLNSIKALADVGYDFVQVQTGRDFKGVNIDEGLEAEVKKLPSNSWVVNIKGYNIELKYDAYFDNFEEEIAKADLVISHAGAGSCLSVLKLNKPLIIVVNEELMDNHQLELANQLEKDGYVFSCTCKMLDSVLYKDLTKLTAYPKIDNRLFSNYLNKCCGF